MCGIVGFVHGGEVKNNQWRADWFSSALYTGALRGVHSTGMFMVERDLEPYVLKAAQEAALFLDRRSVFDVVDGIGWGTRAAVGHNRHATMGKVNYDNAHPYTSACGHVTLVHNGTLKHYHHMQSHHEADTDSARICAQLADEKPEDAIKVLAELNGAYALVWYDRRNCTMNIARNEERPLEYMSLTNNQMFFTSEGAMCSWLLHRHQLTDKLYGTVPFDPHTLYTIHADDKGDFDLKWETREYTPNPFVLPPRKESKVVPIGNATGGSGKVDFQPKTQEKKDALAKRLKDALIKAKPEELVEVQGNWVQPYDMSSGGESSHGCVHGWFDINDQNFLTEDGFQGHLFMDIHNAPVIPDTSPVEIDTYRARVTGLKRDKEQGVTLVGTYVNRLQHRYNTDIWNAAGLEEVNERLDGQRWKYDDEDKAIHRHDYFKAMFTSREVDEIVADCACKHCGAESYAVPTMETFFPAECERLGEFVCGECYGKQVFDTDDAPVGVVKPDVSH